MDVSLNPSQRRRRWPWLLVALALVALTGWIWPREQALRVPREGLWIGTVEQGDLALMVEGFGTLVPREQRLLTAPANAVVVRIDTQPGTPVQPDTLLLQLENPELKARVAESELALRRVRAEARELAVTLDSQAFDEEARAASLRSESATARMQVEAQQQLTEKGVVSRLEFRKNELRAEELAERLALQEKRLQAMQRAREQRLAVAQEKITQAEAEAALRREQYDALSVRAGMHGLLQVLPVKLGQSVAVGTQLAQVGSITALDAEVKVPQGRADLIKAGMRGELKTARGSAEAEVLRIDPVVDNGSVKVVLRPLGDLPSEARPNLAIDAQVHIGARTASLYVERPAGVQDGASVELFVLSEDDVALRRPVRFGAASGRFVEVLDGLKKGERVVLTDSSRWQEWSRLQLTN